MTDPLENARIIFAGSCDFIAGADAVERIPMPDMPEIAFAGRSNVGKSSLINALTGRKTLARTSNTPGRTQQLNFFSLSGRLCLVDMPGYGYAKVSKDKKSAWDFLIRDYLRGRVTLRCVFILIDARHGLKPSDGEIMKLLGEAAVPFRVVFTKADKTSAAERAELNEAVSRELKERPAAWPEPVFTSALKNQGIEELREIALRVAGVGQP